MAGALAGRRQEAQRLEQALDAPEEAQAALLQRIVSENAGTHYGRAHRFEAVKTLADYRSAVPLSRYETFRGDIESMLEGAEGLLTAEPPVFFSRSSATSGKTTHVPFPASVEREYRAALEPMLEALEGDHPGATTRALNITGIYREDTARCGVPIGSASGFVRNLPCHQASPFFQLLPEAIWELTDSEARYYCILRLALAEPLVLIAAMNPGVLMALFAHAEKFGPALIDDLRRGSIEAGPGGAAALSTTLGPRLKPEPAAAERLAATLRGAGRFMPTQAWPALRVIQTWKGGASTHYLAALAERCPTCEVRAAVGGSTEGLLTVPLHGEGAFGGVPALNSSVLEFFPESSPPTNASLVPVTELSQGCGYRVVLTSGRGMYRVLLDDVFTVEGWHRRVPILRFSHRLGLTGSLTGEKLTERQVSEAVSRAAGDLSLALADFQVGPEWGEPPRYLLLVELEREATRDSLLCLIEWFEAELCKANPDYAARRASGQLGQPELLVLARGEFERQTREAVQARGSSDAQVRMTRLRPDLLVREKFKTVGPAHGPG